MQNPGDLRVTTCARELVAELYTATTRLPASERFGLDCTDAAGGGIDRLKHRRGLWKKSRKELIHFLHVALGSASELEFQLIVSVDLALISESDAAQLLTRTSDLKRMLATLIKSLRKRISQRGTAARL